MDSLQDYPDALKVLLGLLQREIARLTSRLELKEIDVEEWQRTMEALIARYSAAAYMTGAGTDELSTLARESLVMHTQAQLGFLDNFAVTIASEPEFMKGWQARAESYAKTIVVPYWQGQTKLLPLPAMPAEGTQCLNNCKCKWEIIPVDEAAGDFDCYWRLMPAEHCQTCTERARTWNPIRIRGGRIQLKEQIKLSLITHKHLAGQHDQATHGRRHMGAIGHGPGGSLPYKNILGARLSELPAEDWEDHNQENIDPDAWKTWVKGTPIPRITTTIHRPNIEKYFSEHPGGMLVFREATTGHGPKGPDSRRVYYYALHRNVRPGEGPWRVTEIDEWGPVGHQAYDTPASLATDFYKSYGYYFGRHSKAKGGFEFLGALDSTVANKALWAITFKHRPGGHGHDQKRHGWRYGSTNQLQDSMRRIRKNNVMFGSDRIDSEVEELKRRARIRRGVNPALAALHHIRDVEAQISKLDHEAAYAFDAEGRELFHVDGKKHEVEFTDQQLRQLRRNGQAIITHNHPGEQIYPGNVVDTRHSENLPFSQMDLNAAAKMNLAEIRVTGPGQYTYSMTRPKDGYWPDPYMLNGEYESAKYRHFPTYYSMLHTQKIPEVSAEVYLRIQVWKDVAERFGMDFNVETGPSKSNTVGSYINVPVTGNEPLTLKHLAGQHDQKLHGSWARQARIRTRRELGTEFARWFGKSKVVDAKGRPLVVYHGTPTSGEHSNNKYVRGEQAGHEFPEFDRFNTQTSGITDSGWLGQGTYFTPDPDFVWEFGNKIMPVYLKVEKPFVINDDHSSGMENLYDFRKSIQDLPGLPEELRLDTHLAESVTYESYGKEKITRYLSAGPGIDTQGRNRFFVFSGSAPDRQFIIESSGRTREEAIARYNWKRTNTEPEGFILHDIGKIGAARFTSILKAAGYDGVMEYRITRDENENPVGKGILSEILVFEPTQIKSSIANVGTWDPNNPSITKEIRYKHLAGRHDQKRHGWRYGSSNHLQDSMRRIRRQAGDGSTRISLIRELEEFKRRARLKRGATPAQAAYQRVRDTEMKIRNLPIEMGFVFDQEGKELSRAMGDRHKVEFGVIKESEFQDKDAIFTHNHPGAWNEKGEGSPFSDADIYFAIRMNVSELRAVTPNGNAYIMRRPEKGWPDRYDAMVAFNNLYSKHYRTELDILRNAHDARWYQPARETYEKIWHDFAQETGATFIKQHYKSTIVPEAPRPAAVSGSQAFLQLKAIREKHMPGGHAHDQKRHGWRYGSTNQIQDTLRRIRNDARYQSFSEWRLRSEEFKRRARIRRGMPAKEALYHEIEDLEKQMRRSAYESCVVLDPEGRKITAKQGDQHKIRFEESEIQKIRGKDAIFTHNHPGDQGLPDSDMRNVEGLPFSHFDLGAAANMDLAEVRAVSSGRKTYIMRRPAKGWPAPEKMYELFFDFRQRLSPDYYKRIVNHELPEDEANYYYHSDIIKSVAQQIGADYIVKTNPNVSYYETLRYSPAAKEAQEAIPV